MCDYIKREDAIKALTDCPVQYVVRICNVPSADVVEVVRCRDCKCCEERGTANYLPFYYCLRIDSSVKANDYCSCGLRKEQENDI